MTLMLELRLVYAVYLLALGLWGYACPVSSIGICRSYYYPSWFTGV